jgi:DNA polymerase (family X)
MNNGQIANAFELIADLLEFQGANAFRVRAYRNGARTVRDYSEPLASLAVEGAARLMQINGIGQDLAAKIITLVQSGDLPMLQQLRAEVPESVLALVKIPGVGPKKAAALHKELGIKTVDELRAACEAGTVRKLKGFGETTEKAILKGIATAEKTTVRMYLSLARGIRRMEFTGSYRRGRDTVGDIDILVVAKEPTAVMDQLDKYGDREEVLARGDTKMSIRTYRGIQVDLRVVPEESFGAALQYFTGSKEHNVVVRGMAKDRGLKINEYGVFRVEDGQETRVAGATEEEVYASIGLPVFPPELREGRREFEWAAAGKLPKLIETSDIRGDLHMHTTASDGTATIEEMVAAAQQRGLAYMAITDHSQRVSMARGLNPQRLLEQWQEVDRVNASLGKKFTVLKGIECDILEKGGMDLPDDVLAQADWVIASVHYGQKQSRQQITERILGAIENPHVCVIAHPTGRLLNRREPYEVDLDAVYAAAKRHRKFLELNANPARLDLNDVYCAAAKSHGIPIVINSDAHSPDGLDVMRYGILQARRAGLTKEDVANTRSWPQICKLLGRS